MTGAALTPAVAAMWLFGTFFLLLILRVPVAFALGLACLPVLFIEPRLSPMVVFNTTFKAYNSFILQAVPFFLLTANLMTTRPPGVPHDHSAATGGVAARMHPRHDRPSGSGRTLRIHHLPGT